MTDTYPLRSAVLAQLGGVAVTGLLILALMHLAHVSPREIATLLAMLQGSITAVIARYQQAPPWWLGIHLAFVPLVVVVHGLEIRPVWFLAAFLLLVFIFWRTDKSRVPLYLSSRTTALALAQLIPPGPNRIIDLGCGEAGLLIQIARERPDCSFVGIEHAPLTWLIAHLRAWRFANISIIYGDFWLEPLNDYDLVYVFLSPAPMRQIWEKASREMASRSLLVSNSFPISDITPEQVLALADRRSTHLFLYRPG